MGSCHVLWGLVKWAKGWPGVKTALQYIFCIIRCIYLTIHVMCFRGWWNGPKGDIVSYFIVFFVFYFTLPGLILFCSILSYATLCYAILFFSFPFLSVVLNLTYYIPPHYIILYYLFSFYCCILYYIFFLLFYYILVFSVNFYYARLYTIKFPYMIYNIYIYIYIIDFLRIWVPARTSQARNKNYLFWGFQGIQAWL